MTPARTRTGRFSATQIILAVAGLALLLLVVGVAVVIQHWPFTEARVRDVIQQRTERQITIQRFTSTYFPPGCILEDVRFLHHKNKDKPPIMTVQKLTIRTHWSQLFAGKKRLDLVIAQGVHVLIPPRTPDAQGKVHSVMPLTAKNGTQMVIADIQADGAVLEFRSSDPKKEPFVVNMHRLSLKGVGDVGPLHYDGAFRITEPPGEISTRGQFGPWDPDDPGSTPVSGTYTFRDADLGVFHKLNGTIASDGKFTGTLEHLDATGATDLPNFRITGKGHTTHLVANYNAVVDARNGDTQLTRVEVHFGRSVVVAHGSVAKVAGEHGKDTRFQGNMNGRIEDAMLPFMKGPKSPMTGKLALTASVELPPGKGTFLEKFRGEGNFGVDAGKFTNAAAQHSIDRLTKSARGDKNRDQEDADPLSVVEGLRGHVSLRNGVATFTGITFHAPDSNAEMHGTINLITNQMDMHGTLRTHGRIADETQGMKSFMLKVITPFMKKKDNVTQMGFKITGETGNPSVGMEFHQKGR